MENSGILIGLMIVGLFTVISNGEDPQELSSYNTQLSQQDVQRDFFDAMGALLGRYTPSTEKRGISQCAVGSRCAMRMGARFGKLCECGGRSNCNSFLLKCI